jgi:hypothetical protein
VGVLPSSEIVVGGAVRRGWWLVVDETDGPCRMVAGPFPDRSEARWAAEASEYEDVRPVYGVGRADGGLDRRPSPEDWAWLAHLGEQLDRLPEDWDAEIGDDDPLTTLVVEVAAALAETGLPLHDAGGPADAVGGVSLLPQSGLGGIVVAWRQHDRMSLDQAHGATSDVLVQQVMNAAVAEVLRLRGFAVEAFGGASGHVVRTAG